MEFDGLRKRQDFPNLTPLIDIVFLLLVFFMLTAHFVQDQSITVDLPEADSSAPLPDDDKQLELIVDEDGRILLEGQDIAAESLLPALQAALAERKNKNLILKGDANIRLEQTVTILDSARKAGAEGVDIMTRRP